MEKAPYRILQVVTKMNRGGTETMLMNHYRALDRTRVQFDFLVHYPEIGVYESEIKSLGGRIFHAPAIRPWTYPSYFTWLDSFFKEHASEFCAVHGHIQENTGFALHYAKKYGIKHRVCTSHAAPLHKDYKYIFREFAKLYLKRSVVSRLACGEKAGKHLYGNNEFTIFKNAINSGLFLFSQETRTKKRAELGISDNAFVIGHVGRFDTAKNQKFIIDTLFEYLSVNKDCMALLIGDGITREHLALHAEKLGIKDKVIFTGPRADINELLQAFDVFMMPSLFEGLPVSVIEAQCAGLPCVLADTIDPATDITGNCSFISLDAPKSKWIDTIEKTKDIKRGNMLKHIINAGYDVTNNLKLLLPFYGITSE